MNAPTLPNWDMTPYFSQHGAADYLGFRDRLKTDVARLLGRLTLLGPPSEANRTSWVALLAELEQVELRARHLESYLECLGSADVRDEAVQRDTAAHATLSAELDKAMLVVRDRLQAAGDQEFEALRADEALSPVRYRLGRMRDQARYSMPLEHETLATDLGITGLSAWGRLYDQVSGTLTFELERPDRAPERLPVCVVQSLLGSPDPVLRQAALAGANRAWEGVADTVAACLNAISGTRLTLYRRRNVAHFLDPALFDAAIDRNTLEAMWTAVRARQHLARRYLGLKARLIGRDRLGFQDLEAPLPEKTAPSIPWQVAEERVLGAFGGFYPALQNFARRALEARWVDWEPREGKRPGGFCSTSPLIDQSRIFMTYAGARGDVTTLAHELGHAYHGWLLRGARRWARAYPMTLAETASTFAEHLVSDALLDARDATDEERRVLLDLRLADAATYLLNLPTRFDFECALYQERQEGELSVSRLRELMLEAQRKNYADALDPTEYNSWFWASKLHFYITDLSFYNFPYVFGFLLSLGLFAQAKAEGPGFLLRYEALLRMSGSDTVENVAREAIGVNLGSPDFWHSSLDCVQRDLERFEALLG
jgi:oligoendopeptidase F